MLENSGQDAYQYFGVSFFFYPNAPRNNSGSTSAAYKKHEDAKKRAYGQRVCKVKHGVFSPLVFSTTGEMGQEATTYCTNRLAEDMHTWKQQRPYSKVINWLRCKRSFAAIRSAIMCIRARGRRSSKGRPLWDVDITLTTSWGCFLQD